MPVDIQQYIAAVQRAILPAAPNTQQIQGLFPGVVPTVDVTRQASVFEYEQKTLVIGGVSAIAYFTIKEQTSLDVSIYHQLSLHIDSNPSGKALVTVQYPGMLDAWVVSRKAIRNIADDPQLVTLAGDLVRQTDQSISLEERNYTLTFLPFKVWPRGTVRVFTDSNLTAGTTARLSFMRELISTPNQTQQVEDNITVLEI